MEKAKRTVSVICILGLLFAVSLSSGCATSGQTGALTGAGAGALVGGLANMHGSWGATALLGAGIGAGIGYLIGNEKDKRDAASRQTLHEREIKPLAGTSWQVVRIQPEPETPYRSIVVHFRPDGTVVTTKTAMDGNVERTTERYRIVGSTLILSKPDYVENTTFRIEGERLTIDYGNGTTVLERVS